MAACHRERGVIQPGKHSCSEQPSSGRKGQRAFVWGEVVLHLGVRVRCKVGNTWCGAVDNDVSSTCSSEVLPGGGR